MFLGQKEGRKRGKAKFSITSSRKPPQISLVGPPSRLFSTTLSWRMNSEMNSGYVSASHQPAGPWGQGRRLHLCLPTTGPGQASLGRPAGPAGEHGPGKRRSGDSRPRCRGKLMTFR